MDDEDENFLMDNGVDIFDLGDDDLLRYRNRLPKRYVRDAQNPFEWYRGSEFTGRYGFSKDAVMNVILPLIRVRLDRWNNRGLPVPPQLQVLMGLRFYRTGNIQQVTGDLRVFSQPTVSRCIRRVSIALALLLNELVGFPETQQEQHHNIQLFYNIRGRPGVGALIDGVLIPIGSPGGEIAEIFRCRKGYFAKNVLAAVGPRGESLHVDVRNPGSVHDQTCLDRSALRRIFEDGIVEGNLLGDNGYASHPYLLVPFERPLNAFEKAYNAAHIPTRCVIEKTFGRWKKKFHC
ncbi:hypothetical protein QAD02_008239 [Eretmocerus hayati]|uniref:Uncharacterized protein n=1 Tax=Eretmocerus hayati TaxID=131215 RepID=A0ACC2N678_9HYME|nr:hypothetical protein QAD02_008239 [Eretmocerus hayati]